MCDDFVNGMCSMIDQSVKERKSTDEPLVQEVLQHISFCQTKCELFHGREESLEVKKSRYFNAALVHLQTWVELFTGTLNHNQNKQTNMG